jgi:lantibiotic modifying enzyme
MSNSSAKPATRSAARIEALLAAVVQAAASGGDYRWNSGKQRFNLGLFRGLAGVGYTLLRQRDAALPNVLIWD